MIKFIDILDGDGVAQGIGRKAIGKYAEKEANHDASAKAPLKIAKLPMMFQLHTQLGLFDGEYLRTWVAELISKRIRYITKDESDGENLTFGMLSELSKKHPCLRQLYVVGVNLSVSQAVTFSADGPCSNVIIADAIRISMSIPGVFQPHSVHRNIGGERKPDNTGHMWVDGGWFLNYPIEIFDEIEPPQHTLGFNLVTDEVQHCLAGLSDAPEAKTDNVMQYSLALFKSTLHQQQTNFLLSLKNKPRTIPINSMGVNTLAFNLSLEQQALLINSGKNATASFFGIAVPPPMVQQAPMAASPQQSDPQAQAPESLIEAPEATTSPRNPKSKQSNRSKVNMSANETNLSSNPQTFHSRAESRDVRQPEYVMVNIWTARSDVIPGHNCGHVSIQMPGGPYISLWPRGNFQETESDLPITKQAVGAVAPRPGRANPFLSRPAHYVQTYDADCFLEGLSERHTKPYQKGLPRQEGYSLAVRTEEDADYRKAKEGEESNPSLEKIWIKPIEANVRFAFYKLDVGRIRNEFARLKDSVVGGWSMAGSNIFSQTFSDETSESCASLAYRLLSEGGFKFTSSGSGFSSSSSPFSSVSTPGDMAKAVIEAKQKEQERHPDTATLVVPGESDLQELAQILSQSRPCALM